MRHLLVVLLSSAALIPVQDEPAPARSRYGHSSHGPAYDEGPRQRPWKMDGIGHAPFPITSKHPDVQQWFDQGNALLHSFWDYEAERAFRWCVKLDPDCAMAYWGLARATSQDRERWGAFLRTAVAKAKGDGVSEKERRYIEAWARVFLPSLEHPETAEPGWLLTSPELGRELEKIIVDYPEDVEAKLLYVLNSYESPGRYSKDLVLRDSVLKEVLAKRPDHPGAVHYRIHNWDSSDLGHVALDSCARYGKIAPSIGHANHMPGHIFTKLGMWHEGAIWLDAATRAEKAYLQERMIVPYQAWNYSHNRNFLAHAQSMLGLPTAALQGAFDLLNAPVDPEYNKPDGGDSTFREGLDALRRTLVRFERWDELLEPGRVPWQDTPEDRMWRAYATALARIGRGELDEAAEEALALGGMGDEFEAGDDADEPMDDEERARTPARLLAIMRAEVEGRLWLARGDSVRGLRSLGQAAELEFALRQVDNDPPVYPRCLYNVLGEAYLDLGSARPAVGAFEKALEVLPNNGFSWAGLARAHHALGELEKARRAYGRMLHAWSGAEAGIWQNERARALGLEAEPEDVSPAPQRDYPKGTLDRLGPNLWQPYEAPELAATDSKGGKVTLDDYRGRNVLLVFYLSDQCVHCVEQLDAIRERIDAFAERDTVVLAISADPPEKNAASKVGSLPFTVLSDTPDHANAIRFKSFDEFEEIELHSTQLIDRAGRLRWVRSGGEPFMDIDFVLGELDRIEEIEARGRLGAAGMKRSATGGTR